MVNRASASGDALLARPVSGVGGGRSARTASVHAAGSAFKSAIVTMPRATARSPSVRQALQNAARQRAVQNLRALPPRLERSSLVHQRQACTAPSVRSPEPGVGAISGTMLVSIGNSSCRELYGDSLQKREGLSSNP